MKFIINLENFVVLLNAVHMIPFLLTLFFDSVPCVALNLYKKCFQIK